MASQKPWYYSTHKSERHLPLTPDNKSRIWFFLLHDPQILRLQLFLKTQHIGPLSWSTQHTCGLECNEPLTAPPGV